MSITKFDLSGKVAIVTGGGSGIGKSIALTLAKQGATVHVLDYNASAAETIDASLDMYFHVCDVTNWSSLVAVTASINETSGGIQILVNNAGLGGVGNIENTTEADFDRLYNVNVKGVFLCTKACFPYLKRSGGGTVINMASIASRSGLQDRIAYTMTKGAVLSMTYAIAKEGLTHAIRSNAVSPGRVHTPLVDTYLAKNYPGEEAEMFDKLAKTQPIGRMGTPQEIADLVLYLASDEAAFVTGANFPIDGGYETLNGT